MRLQLSSFVKPDLAEIGRYIAQDSSKHAGRTLRLLKNSIREIAKQPMLYQLRPDIGADARLTPVGQYVILFRVRNKFVRIERILHGGRNLVAMLDEVDSPPQQ